MLLKPMTKLELRSLSIELEGWAKGTPSIGLRMQDDFPDEIFNTVSSMKVKTAPLIFKKLMELAKK